MYATKAGRSRNGTGWDNKVAQPVSAIRAFYQRFCRAGEGGEVGADGLHTQSAQRSQCDAEEWDAVEGGGELAGLIFKTVAQACLSYGCKYHITRCELFCALLTC